MTASLRRPPEEKQTDGRKRPAAAAALIARSDLGAATDRLSDIGVGIAVLVTPFLLGGRHDIGRLVYVMGCGIAAVGAIAGCAVRRQRLGVPRPFVAIACAAVTLLAIQITPLPNAILSALASEPHRFLPLWGDGSALGAWSTISVTPDLTRQGLALLIGHVLLTSALFARTRSPDDVSRWMKWVGALTIVMTVVAFAQYAMSNGKLLWVYSHPHREIGAAVQGAFANKNHFAHLLALGAGPVCWLAWRLGATKPASNTARQAVRRPTLLVACVSAVLAVGLLGSESRGGFLALTAGATSATFVLWRAGMLRRSHLFGCLTAGILALGGVSWIGYDRVTDRFDDLFAARLDEIDAQQARRMIWAANVDAVRERPWLGFGAGSHREVYPLFFSAPYHQEFTHAESGYLQVATESGLVGAFLLLAAMLALGVSAVRGIAAIDGSERAVLTAAALAGLTASSVHGVVDFVWYLPALMGMTCVLAVCAVRLSGPLEGSTTGVRRREGVDASLEFPWGKGTLCCCVLAVSCIAASVYIGPARAAPSWDAYLRSSVGLRAMVRRIAHGEAELIDRHLPRTIRDTTRRSITLLRDVTRRDPWNARAHLRLAGRLLQLHEIETAEEADGLTLNTLRDVAVHGGFRSGTQLNDWLIRVAGPRAERLIEARRHAETAVRLGPFQGDAYLYLASLDFLAPGGPATKDLVEQALRVRPHDGDVLFESGRQLGLVGEHDRALKLWRRCAQRPGGHIRKLVASVATVAPASEFIRELDPGLEAIDAALRVYQLKGDHQDLMTLCDHAQAAVRNAEENGEYTDTSLAHRWRHLSATYRQLDRHDEAALAANRAAELAPHDLWVRLEVGTALFAAARYDEADPHLRWCLARRPDLSEARLMLQEGVSRRTAVDRNRRARSRLYATLASTKTTIDTAAPTDESPTDQPRHAETAALTPSAEISR